MRTLALALGSLTLVSSAVAQSINVDFGPANSPGGVPTPNYGGSAGARGVWNAVSAVSVSGLRRWDGEVTGVSLTLNEVSSGCGAMFGWTDAPGTSGQDGALLDDRYSPDGFGPILTFQGLELGEYLVDTIVPVQSCNFHGMNVSVVGSTDPVRYLTAGDWPGSFVEGEHYSRHAVTVTDGTLVIHVGIAFADYAKVSGIQLVHGEQQYRGVPFCFGDASGSACPCANQGSEGRGCQNSASTGGAVLFATGTTSPDTVVLRSSGQLPNALSIFLQGDVSIGPVLYGDGLRCAGGTLRRLYSKAANGGEAIAPLPGDPSISTRSAQLGDPIPVNARRYYQVFYRDPNPSFCTAPPGSTFNISSAVSIRW